MMPRSRLIEKNGSQVVTGWPMRIHRYDPSAIPDPADMLDSLIIINDRADPNRGHVAVSNGRSWDRIAYLDERSAAPAAQSDPTKPEPEPPRDLAALKGFLCDRLDAEAGAITDGPGHGLLYDRKRREAYSAIDNPKPTAEQYPVLAASIGIEIPSSGNAKADFDAIALLVIQKEQAWASVAARIEAKRLSAKRAVQAAFTAAEAEAAARVVW